MNVLKISDNLYLNEIPVKTDTVNIQNEPVNHIMIVDCSGSMSDSLPKIRNQLKNKLPALLNPSDTFSLIWFSSRNLHGVILDHKEITNAESLTQINTVIDKWLKPNALTGFVGPLTDAIDLSKGKTGVYSLFFITDGYDNEYSTDEILKTVGILKDSLNAAVFVEYGWYCQHDLLVKMAETSNGNLVFAENFDKYEPVMVSSLSARPAGKKIAVDVVNPIENYVFSMTETGPVNYPVITNQVKVPVNTDKIYYFTFSPDEKPIVRSNVSSLNPVYQGVIGLSAKGKAAVVKTILEALGDVKLYRKYANCFGKQNLLDFQALALAASLDDSQKYLNGQSDSLAPDENAITVLDVLEILFGDDNNVFFPDALKEYKRVSRRTDIAVDNLTEDEQEEIDSLLANAKTAAALKNANKRIQEIADSKPKTLKFTPDNPNKGYVIKDLVWNETRPNISFMISVDGTVDLSNTEYAKKKKVPAKFHTRIHRNYTVIRDGIVNMDIIPMKLSEASFLALRRENIVPGKYDSDAVYEINIRDLPILNQANIKNMSAKKLGQFQFLLLSYKAEQKIYKYFKELWAGKKTSEDWNSLYGEEITNWLKEMGLTSYNGFNPKRTVAESTDFYYGVEMKVSLKGMSNLPSVSDLEKKINSGKNLTVSEQLLYPAYESCLKHENDKNRIDWIERLEKETITLTRATIKQMAQLKFGIVIGQAWFSDLKSREDNTFIVKTNKIGDLECKINISEVKINI